MFFLALRYSSCRRRRSFPPNLEEGVVGGRGGGGGVLGLAGLVGGRGGGGRVLRLALVGDLGHVAAVAVHGVGHLKL